MGSGSLVEAEGAEFYKGTRSILMAANLELNPRRNRTGKAIFLKNKVRFSLNCAPVAEEDEILLLLSCC